MKRQRVLLSISLMVVFSGCSTSFDFSIGGQRVEDSALDLIDGELADSLGFGPLESTCDEVAEPGVGSVFSCESITPDGDLVDWEVTVDREDHIDVQSQNVLAASRIAQLETDALDLLFGSNPKNVTLDCGDVSRVLDDDNSVVCSASAAANPADTYDATVFFDDPSRSGTRVELDEAAPFAAGPGVDALAHELITTTLTDTVDLGPLSTTCDPDPSSEVGTVFGCESSTSDAETIVWIVTVDREDHIDVQSQNLLLAAVLPKVAEAAIESLYGDNNPLEVTIDCGRRTRIVQPDHTVLCDATTPTQPGSVFDTTFTFDDDLSSGNFDVVVNDEPRG